MPNEKTVTASLKVGAVVNDRYELLEMLGRGGMSEVYRARDRQIARDVAVKLLHRHLAADEEAIKRFQREAVATSELKHQNIVDVFAFGICENRPYIVMELIEGTNLADVLRVEGHLSQERAIPIFSQVVDALQFAHSRGIVHRDLKPGNIMLFGSPPTVKVVDFGIAKILPESGKEMQKLTQTGELFGTVIYMSPEQCMSMPLDGRSDIYSLGCIMYETLEGAPPLVASESFATMAKHLNETAPDGKLIGAAFMNVVRRCLEKEPHKRPSAAQLGILLGNPGAWRPADKRKAYIIGLAACVALGLSGLLAKFALDSLALQRARTAVVSTRSSKHGTYNGVDLWTSVSQGEIYNPIGGDVHTGNSVFLAKAHKEKDVATKVKLLNDYLSTCPTNVFDPNIIDARLLLGDAYLALYKRAEAADQFSLCRKQLEPIKNEKKNDYLRSLLGLGVVNAYQNLPICETQLLAVANERGSLLRTDKYLLSQAEMHLAEYYAGNRRFHEAQQMLAKAHADSRGESSQGSVDAVVYKLGNLVNNQLKSDQR